MSDLENFLKSNNIRFKKNELGSNLTTLAVGGKLNFLIEPNNDQELLCLAKYIFEKDIPAKILGAGSNLIISDHEITEPVLKLGRNYRYYSQLDNAHDKENVSFEIGAAMPLMSLSRELSEKGYQGLEFAGGIPASFGGAVRMNVGAHGNEIKDILSDVTYLNSSGHIVTVKKEELIFSYRHSSIPRDALIVRACICLKSGDAQSISEKRREFLDYRKKTQPLTLPSFGSVFKNPSKELSAGLLIEKSGLKGYKIGGAEVSRHHANWIVNPQRQASAADVTELIQLITDKVKTDSGILLEKEVVCW